MLENLVEVHVPVFANRKHSAVDLLDPARELFQRERQTFGTETPADVVFVAGRELLESEHALVLAMADEPAARHLSDLEP